MGMHPSGPAPVEPSADLRTFANNLRQMYVALTDQGFSTMEALTICGQVIAAGIAAGGKSDG